MFKFGRRSGLFIPRRYESEGFYHQIKSFLTRRVQNYNSPDYVVYKFYQESNDFLLIPRYFPLDRFASDYHIIDKREEGQTITINHNITPRDKLQRQAIKYIMTHENGILQLDPGVGKTVISIYMIATRKKKTMILVHKDALADQWKGKKGADPPKGLLSFTDLQEDDIARLTSATFEKDLQKPIIIATDQTFLSLLKRRRTEFLTALDNAGIGIFIGDEVHTTVGAPTFSECSAHIPSKYTYGLSATPYRHDGNGDVINFHLGEIYNEGLDAGTMAAKVTVMLLDYEIDTRKRFKYLHWAGSFQRSRYLNLMRKSQPLIHTAKGLLNKFKGNRDLIFVSERINLIDLLYDWLEHDSKSKFIASAKLDQLEYNTTFTTPGKMRDGVDAPHKDCAILSSPISNIAQMSGRIVRTHPNKQRPILIDMVDIGCKEIARTLFKRLSYYDEKNWDVQFVILNNKTFKVITRDNVIEILEGR